MIKREAVYKRELNHSYMVLECSKEELAERYDYRIMMHNRIGRLLPCSLRQMDGEDFLYYEISSKQPLERLYEGGKLKAGDLACIIREIAAVQEDLGEYMLDESGLLLEKGMIFADVETRELYFAFYPGSRSGDRQYEGLADFFLGHTDHGQEQAVNLAYEFYRMSKADYFVLSSFLPILEKELAATVRGAGSDQGRMRREAAGNMAWQYGAGYDFADGEDRKCSPGGGEWGSGDIGSSADQSGWMPDPPEKTGWDDMELLTAQDLSAGQASKPEEEAGKKRTGVFRWLLSFLKKEKKTKTGQETKEEWSDMVWDSYEQQLYESGSQETVYFADLDKKETSVRKTLCLKAEEGGRKILLRDFPITFGKMQGRVTVVLEDRSVSRIHARIEAGEKGLYVRDLNSRNGTCINGKKLLPDESAPLREGDQVSFGREYFRCERA